MSQDELATLTPPEVGRILRVAPEKVIGFILAGELDGFNVADRTSKRPRYRITREALRAFQQRRTGAATPRPVKGTRRKQHTAGKRYF